MNEGRNKELQDSIQKTSSSTKTSHITTFSFASFSPGSCSNGELLCMGSAATSGEGYINLTPDPSNSSSTTNQIGRVLYPQRVPVWPALITTTFTIRITPMPNSTSSGDGITFLLAQDNNPSPPQSYGAYLGLFEKSPQVEFLQQIAVEFDTFMNEFDPDGNHIGIDTRSIVTPVAAVSLNDSGIQLTSGRDIEVQIDYDGSDNTLYVSMGYSRTQLKTILNQSIELSNIVPSAAYVGFTASTGSALPESHQVLNWVFTSVPLPLASGKTSKEDTLKTILVIVIPILGVAFISSVPFIWEVVKRGGEKGKKEEDIESLSRRSGADMPKEFTFKQLSKATCKFSKDNLLGRGGFGCVYKGFLTDPKRTIAVKKISATSKQGLASALLYLHEECGSPMVHRDVKPNNVMLDSNYNPQLGDFGLARLLHNDESVLTNLIGTPGYLAPEIGFTGKATPESDVYSFGIVMLEVICGKRSISMVENGLVDYVWDMYLGNTLLECVDNKLMRQQLDEEEAKRALMVGLACSHPNSMLRPKMRKVVHILLNRSEPLMELPKERPTGVYMLVPSSSAITNLGAACCADRHPLLQTTATSLDEISIVYDQP
ncbi:putative L-type lectin-domain containing receptor kinase S.5 [Senna tora]|uniref:non-specific serine/threonine protein kinase n=1 Tax=Senna tora TaxID=362788 RepID=A0A834WRW7_9FABA|nr:putative L-type lectin-domain containing receptor kinase S.5 [Senna tora]